MLRTYSHIRRKAKLTALDRLISSREEERTAASNVIPITAKKKPVATSGKKPKKRASSR